jgi:hypothetical protein
VEGRPVARSSSLEFFRARAAEASADAEAATLDHVRERCRRSEAAWTELADRAARTAKLRETIINEKAAEALLHDDPAQ